MSKQYKQKAGNGFNREPTAKKIASQQHTEFERLFHQELEDMIAAETQLTTAWSSLANKADASILKELLTNCADTANSHLKRLNKINDRLSFQSLEKTCEAIWLIIATVKNFKQDNSNDKSIAIVAQKAIHYLMASYDGLMMLADNMQQPATVVLLQEMLATLGALDERLGNIAPASDIHGIAA